MRTIIPRASSYDAPSSYSKRRGRSPWKEEEEMEEMFTSSSSSSFHPHLETAPVALKRRHSAASAVSRFRSVVMSALLVSRHNRSGGGMGSRVTGTLYGHRRGHVRLAFQAEAKSCPVVLLELATPTSNLVREMASGLVRIALECERKAHDTKAKEKKVMEEPMWRAYCNGRKCGYAVRRECGANDWKVLKAVEPVSMGAGVLPKEGDGGEEAEGEMMYMRARFERVVGSRDSEAFYMMNPDGHGGTELSIYFLRV